MKKEQLIKAGEIIKEYAAAEEWTAITYQQALQNVKDGFLAIYYADARNELRKIYNETEEEAEKYSDKKVWDQYCHVMAMMAGKKKYLL